MNLAHPLLSSVLCRLVIGAVLIAVGRGSVPAEWVPYLLLVAGAADVTILWWLIETVREIVSGTAPKPAPVDSGHIDQPPGPVQPPAPPVQPPAKPPAASSDARFAACIPLTLGYEGGNDDDPRDPGGRTSRGILQTEWDSWRSTHPGLPADVWQAPQDQVLAIYKANYWEAMSCGSLAPGVDFAVFDFGVNSGNSRSAKFLQNAVGVDQDGEIGPDTIAAAAKLDPAKLIGDFCDARLAFLKGLGTWGTFGKGWSNRVSDVRAKALAMADGTPAKLPPAANIPAPSTAPWLATMRSLLGTHAEHDNATIMSWPAAIAAKFPDMADYCHGYVHDSIPWCGLTVAYVMAMNGIRPVFGASDTDKFLWAFAWQNFGTAVTGDPQPGDVMVFRWAGGGGHVTLYDHEVDDDYYHCTGGNQGSGHVVSTESMPMANCIAIRRPPQ